MPKRYYLHGDLVTLSKYYCAICDAFEEEQHFYSNKFHWMNNRQKYIDSIERRKKANKTFLKNNVRPANSINLFSDIQKKKNGKFYIWLKKQKERDDPIGDLAKDALEDESFPIETDSLKRIRTHLFNIHACDEAIQALSEAFDEYKSKSRSDISVTLRFEIFRADKYKCQICGAEAKDGAKLEVDHKIPVSKGGSNDRDNLWTLCFKCNRVKGVRRL